jgi:hypothetical protein
LINIIREGSVAYQTAAIDGSPETPYVNTRDSALLPGQSLCDRRSGVCITVLSKEPGQLNVRVQFMSDDPDNQPPDSPTVTTTVVPQPDGTFLVEFDGASQDPDGDALFYFWNFDTNWYQHEFYNDGNYAHGNQVSHVYPNDDPIRSYVKVTDMKGGVTEWVSIDLFGFQDTYISVPNDYSTIQEAIDESEGGEIIEIAPGTYTGAGNRDIKIGRKRVTVRGSGPGATILDAQGSPGDHHRAFIFDNDSANAASRYTVIEDLTIRNGYADEGGAVFVGFSQGPVFRDNIIEDNYATLHGGAIFVERLGFYPLGGGPAFVGNTIRNNSAASNGGAVYAQLVGEFFTLEGNVIEDNTAIRGAGLYHNSPQYQATIRNNVWARNSASADGGAMYIGSASVPVSLVNSTVARNSALNNGAGVYGIGSWTQISNGIFWDNDSSSGLWFSGQPVIRYSDVMDGWVGEGNIDASPRFQNPNGGDFRLKKVSPCIDAADGSVASTFDLLGKPRYDVLTVPNTGIGYPDYVDLGAYERQRLQAISLPIP